MTPIDPAKILRGRAMMTQGMGLDAAFAEKAVFHFVWGKMFHLIPAVSDHIRDQVDAGIDNILNELLSQ